MPIFKRGEIDLYFEEHHPESSALAPRATLIERWTDAGHQPAARQAVQDFLAAHTPR